MRGKRVFKATVEKACSGRYRWVVAMGGTSLAAGWAPNRILARRASCQKQEELHRTIGDRLKVNR